MSNCTELTNDKPMKCADFEYEPRWSHIKFDEENGNVYDGNGHLIGINGRFNEDKTAINMEIPVTN